MRRIILLSILLVAGCEGVVGPRAHRQNPNLPIDDPSLSIAEQKQRGRDQLALPDTTRVLPRTYGDFPGPTR